MGITRSDINLEEGEFELQVIPLATSYLVQISSDIIRGTIMIDRSLDKDDLDEINTQIFNFIEEISMRGRDDDEKTFAQ